MAVTVLLQNDGGLAIGKEGKNEPKSSFEKALTTRSTVTMIGCAF